MSALTGTILIVDDTPQNISLLFDYLSNQNFDLLVAEDGESALKITQQEMPDLLLLDVMMPGMDGFTVCRQLKKIEQVKDIPVIFMTALSEVSDKVNGFEAGGVDYVTKPFQQEEVLARITTHLTLCRLQNTLKQQNERLLLLNQEKNEFLGIAAHDLKNPISAISALTSFMLERDDLITKDKLKRNLETINRSTEQMIQLIDSLLNVNTIESGQIQLNLKRTDFMPLFQELLEHYSRRAQEKNLSLDIDYPPVSCSAMIDSQRFRQVLDNLLSNAIKYSPPDKAISIHVYHQNEHITTEIRDQGPGLSKEDQHKLFNKFCRLTPLPTGGESSTGLGLFIVKKLVNAMQGEVWCESEVGQGCRFFVQFPALL